MKKIKRKKKRKITPKKKKKEYRIIAPPSNPFSNPNWIDRVMPREMDRDLVYSEIGELK